MIGFSTQKLYPQETHSLTSKREKFIKTGIGIGVCEGRRETGIGILYSFGLQKSLGEKKKIRINPNLMIGGFSPFLGFDIDPQFFRITSLGLNLHYDLLSYKSLSIVTSPGIFINYSRGIIRSRYFASIYYGGALSCGIRVAPADKKLAYEIRPVNIQVGNIKNCFTLGSNCFVLGYFMLGIDIKLNK